jgi:hypothetical protein
MGVVGEWDDSGTSEDEWVEELGGECEGGECERVECAGEECEGVECEGRM